MVFSGYSGFLLPYVAANSSQLFKLIAEFTYGSDYM
jgi:hypothetical protein